MNVYAISDLHLSESVQKPMDIFGGNWEGHFEKIKEDWLSKVQKDDIVLIGGDTSWALKLEDASADFELLRLLPGKKIVIRGNHDYWWTSLKKVTDAFPDFIFLQNNSVKIENIIIAGSRGWTIANESSTAQDIKIYLREIQRLTLSLDCATKKRKENDTLIALMHYPPFDADFADTEITALFKRYNVDIVTYGHLHGKNVRLKREIEKDGIRYYLTSCDLIDNKLVKLI